MSGIDRDELRPDEMTLGRPRPPRPPRRVPGRRPLLVVIAGFVVGLLVGASGAFLLGDRAGSEGQGTGTLVVGPVAMPTADNADGPIFTLQVRNGGGETVEVRELAFDGFGAEAFLVDASHLAAGTWGRVQFRVEPDCGVDPADHMETVRLTVRTSEGEVERRLPLPEAGLQLAYYHAVRCASGAFPLPEDLVGTWVVEEAFGDQAFVGTMVWVVRQDGSFVADPEGLAHAAVEHGVDGRWVLEDGELRLRVTGGYGGCTPGEVSRWRPNLFDGPLRNALGEPPPRLTAVWVGGSCPDSMKGQVWVLRRLLDGIP